ncbi:MAG: phosphate signaling complex protein PhoU [Negativicutes bacterium]|nr:phosphate signaling complex protein PhoU [Negativicutes bacterium]
MGENFSWLQQAITKMGGQTTLAVERAVQALLKNDAAAAAATREIEKTVDAMFEGINEYCLDVLTGNAYTRSEVNFIVGSLRIAMELERICDYANQIAKLVQRKFTQQDVEPFKCLLAPAADMKDHAVGMLRSALKSYEERNPAASRMIKEQDAIVDKRNKNLIRDMVCIASVKPWTQEVVMDYHTSVRYIERVADRATNIAELVYYIAQGESMKKKPLREDIWHD